jgi:hypothetical protein
MATLLLVATAATSTALGARNYRVTAPHTTDWWAESSLTRVFPTTVGPASGNTSSSSRVAAVSLVHDSPHFRLATLFFPVPLPLQSISRARKLDSLRSSCAGVLAYGDSHALAEEPWTLLRQAGNELESFQVAVRAEKNTSYAVSWSPPLPKGVSLSWEQVCAALLQPKITRRNRTRVAGAPFSHPPCYRTTLIAPVLPVHQCFGTRPVGASPSQY